MLPAACWSKVCVSLMSCIVFRPPAPSVQIKIDLIWDAWLAQLALIKQWSWDSIRLNCMHKCRKRSPRSWSDIKKWFNLCSIVIGIYWLFQSLLAEALEEVVHLDLLPLCLKASFLTGKQVVRHLCWPQHTVLILISEFTTRALHYTGAFFSHFFLALHYSEMTQNTQAVPLTCDENGKCLEWPSVNIKIELQENEFQACHRTWSDCILQELARSFIFTTCLGRACLVPV